ncbi:hypothetical protein DSECCO2_587870 [anaerobic digester metagenome]
MRPPSSSRQAARLATLMARARLRPIFSKCWMAPESGSGTHTAARISPGRRTVLPGPVMKFSTGTARVEDREASSRVAPRAYRAGSVSPAGEAVQMLPPRVAWLRTRGEPS